MTSKSRGRTPRRGDIWWVVLDPVVGSEIAKTRPCLVLSTNSVNLRRRAVVAIPLSTSPQPQPPLRVAINCSGYAAVAVIDQIRAIAKERLRTLIGTASNDEMRDIEAALRRVLEL